MLESGQELSARFVLVRRLGTGGSGEVWLAQDRERGCFVALKILRDDLMQDVAAIAALQREFEHVRTLGHPNILRVDGVHRSGRYTWIAMEYASGGDLSQLRGRGYREILLHAALPIAAAVTERFSDLDELYDIGDIDLHISGCINSCGHHHSGHIGILGVDKDGKEWYQVSLGGMDGSALGGPAAAGKVIGPSFAADEVPDVIEAVIDAYRGQRSAAAERFIDTVRRVGLEPFRSAANAVRRATAVAS